MGGILFSQKPLLAMEFLLCWSTLSLSVFGDHDGPPKTLDGLEFKSVDKFQIGALPSGSVY